LVAVGLLELYFYRQHFNRGCARSDPAHSSIDVDALRSRRGGAQSGPQLPIQVQSYDPQPFILRQTFALDLKGISVSARRPQKALLISAGTIADAAKMARAQTVLGLLPLRARAKIQLLVVYPYGHTDRGDGELPFASLTTCRLYRSNCQEFSHSSASMTGERRHSL
jgi:hypothetical protein